MTGPALLVAARTDVGRQREHNEDSLVAEHPLYMIADGVGGAVMGELASRLAADAMRSAADHIAGAPTADLAADEMRSAVEAANDAVHRAQVDDPALRGMSTTLTAVVVRAAGEIVVGHVGDSRLYHAGANGFARATTDHSVVQELLDAGRIDPADSMHHPQRNVITRAIGPEPRVVVDVLVDAVAPGDWLLVCSDGLTDLVEEHEIERAIAENAAPDPEVAVERLVAQANARGGTDNISVVLLRPLDPQSTGELAVVPMESESRDDAPGAPDDLDASGRRPGPRPHGLPTHARRPRPVTGILVAAAVAVVAALLGGVLWSQSYFLTERGDGSVGIDHGFPLAGLSRPWRDGSVDAADLSPADREELVDSHRIRSKADAVKVLEQLPDRAVGAGTGTVTGTASLGEPAEGLRGERPGP